MAQVSDSGPSWPLVNDSASFMDGNQYSSSLTCRNSGFVLFGCRVAPSSSIVAVNLCATQQAWLGCCVVAASDIPNKRKTKAMNIVGWLCQSLRECRDLTDICAVLH